MPASVPYAFSPGQVAASAQVNANFTALVNYLNGLSIPTTPVTIANGGTGGSTIQTALTALGLGAGTVVPCTVSVASLTLTVTTTAAGATVSSYQNGLTLLFRMPNSVVSGGNVLIAYQAYGGTALTAVPLYDAGGQQQITATLANQVMLITYQSALGGFVLVNTPPSAFNAARFAQFEQSSSAQTWTCPSGVTLAYVSGCGAGGAGGGVLSNADSGGGGGGAGDSILKQALTVTPGGAYVINVGLSGAGTAGGNGGNGGSTTMTYSGSSLITLGYGHGGTAGTNTSPSSGGAQGGSGGSNGREGFLSGSLSVGGAGGDCLLGKGGTPAFDGQNGQNGQGFGSGGAGASGSSGGSTTGGAGGPGYLLLEW